MSRTRLLCPDEAVGGEANREPANSPADKLAAAETQAAEAIARYRQLVASGPGLVPEMVQGNTLEEIDASVQAARHAYEEISRQIARGYEREVPTGNPARSAATLAAEALKPEAKIALGLRGK